MMYCPRCKKDVQVWWGVCDICGYDITHPHNNLIGVDKIELRR